MTKKVLISAGEASGDLHAATLIKELQQLSPGLDVIAMGGNNLRNTGARVVIDCADLAVVGLVEVLINYRKLKAALDKLKAIMISEKPDLLIVVDYQEFNLRLAETAKQHGIPVLFYIGPQVWAWRSDRVYSMREKVDMMAVLFPFEVEFYEKAGMPVRFVGNPLVDEAKADKDKTTLLAEYQLDPDKPIVGLLPGSRRSELKRVLPIQLASAKALQAQHPEVQFILAVASTLNKDDISAQCAAHPELNINVVQDRPYNIMSVCDAIMSASGTATLEIGLMGIPLAITYRVSPITYAIIKRMMTIDQIGLVNIVAQKPIIKEFIQGDAQPKLIAAEISRILTDTDYRDNMINELAKIREKLGTAGGSRIVAELANDMLEGRLTDSASTDSISTDSTSSH